MDPQQDRVLTVRGRSSAEQERQGLILLTQQVLQCRAVGVTQLGVPDGVLVSWAASDHDVMTADLIGRRDSGASISLRTNMQVNISDLAAQQQSRGRFQALEWLGVGSLLVTPFDTGAGVSGEMTAYWSEPVEAGPRLRSLARGMASQIAAAISHERTFDQLHAALDSRTTIGQAQGILMARFGLDADGAFAVLSRHAHGSHTTLRQVAASLVQTDQLPRYADPAVPH